MDDGGPFHRLELEHRVRIRASADAVYGTIADVTRMGEWSPECIESR